MKPKSGGLYLHSASEPFNEEGQLDYKRVDLWLEHFGLNRVQSHCSGHSKGQDLLYLQAQSTSVDSPLVGMSLVEHGEVRDEPAEPDQWPYQSVLDAIRDGWRIVKFPEMAVLLNEERTYGLGHEFDVFRSYFPRIYQEVVQTTRRDGLCLGAPDSRKFA